MRSTGTKKTSSTSAASKRRVKERDPNKPKRWLSSFFVFCREHRQEVKAKLGDVAAQYVTKELTERWRAITPEEKKRYEALAHVDRERYNREMEEYEAKRSGI